MGGGGGGGGCGGGGAHVAPEPSPPPLWIHLCILYILYMNRANEMPIVLRIGGGRENEPRTINLVTEPMTTLTHRSSTNIHPCMLNPISGVVKCVACMWVCALDPMERHQPAKHGRSTRDNYVTQHNKALPVLS